MRILWSIHLYPPYHNCGAEYMAHSLNKYLMTCGHKIRVLLHQGKGNRVYDFQGVDVFPIQRDSDNHFTNTDIVITHLDYTKWTIGESKRHKKPVIHFVHNSTPYPSILNNPDVYVVYNSEWIKNKLNYPNKSFVLTPPCDWRHYDVNDNPEESEYITLINLDWNKGGTILRELAKRMPQKKFLGVTGSYSATDDGQILNQPGNVKVIPNTSDILPVYKKTRVLIMPSLFESWGRTATEAMCNGIPVVASATPGLTENCGKAGLYVDNRNDIDAWVRWIERLDDKKFYKQVSKKCKERSRELDPVEKMKEFEEWLIKIGNGQE